MQNGISDIVEHFAITGRPQAIELLKNVITSNLMGCVKKPDLTSNQSQKPVP